MPSAASNRHSGNGRVKRPQWPMAHPVPAPVVVAVSVAFLLRRKTVLLLLCIYSGGLLAAFLFFSTRA